MKAHPPERLAGYLGATRRIQAHLHQRGFPAPRPLVGPVPFGIGLATVDEFVDKGESPDGHDPKVRHSMARTLYSLIELAGEVVDDFPGRMVVGHADWSVDQVRFGGEDVAVVYDWDSLRPEKEVVIVGIAASNFTSTWHAEEPNLPSPIETRLFVEDCEHALDGEGQNLEGSFREALPVHAGAYFRSGSLGEL